MKKDNKSALTIKIFGNDYRISCEAGQEDDLHKAGRFLDGRMREIRANGSVIGTDRIAVMAALNLSHELLTQQTDQDSAANSASKRIRTLRERVEIALNDSTQLEL